MKFIDVQENFKQYWKVQHPHRQANSTHTSRTEDCLCERCIGKKPTDSWSLQDCMAYEFNQYLPKLYSKSDFDIGLDPKLERFNNEELNHRKNLTEYAFNDCLCMEIIIQRLKTENFKFNIGQSTRARSKPIKTPRISFSDSDDDGEIYLSQLNPVNNQQSNEKPPTTHSTNRTISFSNEEPPTIHSTNRTISPSNVQPTTTHSTSRTVIFSSESSKNRTISLSNEHLNRQISITSNEIFPSNEQQKISNQSTRNRTQTDITEDEKKKIHNRTCTRKQRMRCYQHEIIKKNIDNRFSYTDMKKILKRLNIPATLLNKSTLPTSNATTLFIGIRYPENMQIYIRKTSKLFSTEHYQQFMEQKQRNNRHEDHRRSSKRTRNSL